MTSRVSPTLQDVLRDTKARWRKEEEQEKKARDHVIHERQEKHDGGRVSLEERLRSRLPCQDSRPNPARCDRTPHSDHTHRERSPIPDCTTVTVNVAIP